VSERQDTPPTPTRGVPVELGGQQYFLRYTMATLRKIRQEMGPQALAEGVGDDKLIKVLWYGFKNQHPDLTEEQVEELIDLRDLKNVVIALRQAMGGTDVKLVPPMPAPAATSDSASA